MLVFLKSKLDIKSDKHMISDEELTINTSLTECPFLSTCPLPKIHFLCKIPDCKNCPDYITKLKKVI